MAASVGGTGAGHAATSFQVTLSPLIGTIGNDIPQVSFGGKIGYHLFVTNSGDSTTQHGRIVVTSNKATFSDASDTTNCAVNPKDAHQMVCTPFGGTFTPGATFTVDLRFTAPSNGTQVSTVAAVTVAAQSVGGPNNGTTLAQSDPVLTTIVENTTKADTFLHVNENAGTGDLSGSHPQNFSAMMPTSFFGDPFGIALSIHDDVGTPLVAGGLTSVTTVDIPTAPFPATPGNPFHNGVDPDQPYGWSMTAKYPNGFQLTRLVHKDDNNVTTDVLSCASIGGAPTLAQPLCWDTLDQIKGNTKLIMATGRGLENGQFGFG